MKYDQIDNSGCKVSADQKFGSESFFFPKFILSFHESHQSYNCTRRYPPLTNISLANIGGGGLRKLK